MSLALQLVASAERNPRADAVVAGDVRWDYATLLAKVQATAGGLRSTGVVPGGRVAVALRNGPEMLVLFWATQWLGAWFVPVNWRLKPADIDYCVSDAEATVFAFEPDTANVPVPAGVASFDAVSPGGLPAGEPVGEPAVASWDEPALMLYTSGTTGRPKGVPRSHRAEWTAALAHTIQCRHVPGERTLGVMPWYHTMGMRSLLAMVALDGCVVVQPAFSAAAALDAIAAERIGSLYLAPTLFHDLVREARSRPGAAPRVPRLAYAGAPMTSALAESCREVFQPEVFINHYGSTEIYTFTIDGNQAAKPGCAGKAGIHSRIRLVSTAADAGPSDLVAAGDTGQVICFLDNTEAFSGYWHRPEADSKAIRDGWYFTGDLGHVDGDGDLWVQGRVDDMIISGGENVSPVEIEDALSAHPLVREVAVVGAPDERLGEKVVACVVADEGALDASILDEFCVKSETLATFKRPREYHFLDELPKTSSGKVLRHQLRELIAGEVKAGDADG